MKTFLGLMTAKRTHYPNIIAVGISVLIILLFWGQNINQEPLPDNPDGSANTYPSKKARADYFHRMLKDPATGEIPKGIRKKELAYAATLPGHTKANKTASQTNISWTEEKILQHVDDSRATKRLSALLREID